MANERLADLTEQEIYEAALSNPKIAKAIVDSDPRTQLFERVYNSDRKFTGGKSFREVIEDMGVAVAPDSTIARARTHARAEIADDVAAIKALREKLEKEAQAQSLERFRDGLRARATELGYSADDKEVDQIVRFMWDNEYGPKSAAVAVEKYFESKAPAEPNFEKENVFNFADEDAEYVKQLLGSPPGADTSALTQRHAEKLWKETFGPGAAPRRPA